MLKENKQGAYIKQVEKATENENELHTETVPAFQATDADD